MAALDKKCRPFIFTGWKEGKKKREIWGRYNLLLQKQIFQPGEKSRGWVKVVDGGEFFFFLWRGLLIVLNKGTFIFVLWPVTASGNSSVS